MKLLSILVSLPPFLITILIIFQTNTFRGLLNKYLYFSIFKVLVLPSLLEFLLNNLVYSLIEGLSRLVNIYN